MSGNADGMVSVVMLWGPQAGAVVALPWAEARPLLADGQARVVESAARPRVERIASRQDRGLPRARHGAVR